MNLKAKNIQIIDSIASIRTRTEMYISGRDNKGLQSLIQTILDYSITEAKLGFCQNIHVTIHDDQSMSIEDDGRGIPSPKDVETNKKFLEELFTVLLVGGKSDFPVINALSSKLTATIYCNGKVYKQTYQKGRPQNEVQIADDTDKHGMKIHFYPDITIFENPVFDANAIKTYIDQQTTDLKGLNIKFDDERAG